MLGRTRADEPNAIYPIGRMSRSSVVHVYHIPLGDTGDDKNVDERQRDGGNGAKHGNEPDGKGEKIQDDGRPG